MTHCCISATEGWRAHPHGPRTGISSWTRKTQAAMLASDSQAPSSLVVIAVLTATGQYLLSHCEAEQARRKAEARSAELEARLRTLQSQG
jgi:hypothetical protein